MPSIDDGSAEWRADRWAPIASAPPVQHIRGRSKAGRVYEPMHYACGGGEEQPPYNGWFVATLVDERGPVGYAQVTPVEWQPLNVLPALPPLPRPLPAINLAEQAAQCRTLASNLAAPARPMRPRKPRLHPSICWRALHAEGLHELGCTALAEPVHMYVYLLMLAELLEHEYARARTKELRASPAATPQLQVKEGSVEVL